jgi:hypothetical protein
MELTPVSRVVSMDNWLKDYINSYDESKLLSFIDEVNIF